MDGTMKAIIFERVGRYALVEKSVPKIRNEYEMLVRIDACSICGSDMHILSDPPGYPAQPGTVLGHEMVGTVVEMGDKVVNYELGDRVVCDNNIPCGQCYYCKSGHQNMCEHMICLGVDGDGFFAQYSVIPDFAAVKIDKRLPIDQAVFTEPLSCVMGAIKKIKVLPGETVIVIGAGPIGLYFIQLLKLNGAGKVIAVEINEFRQEFARKMGADAVVSPEDLEEILLLTKGLGADLVADAVGSCLGDAVRLVRSAGRILLFGQNFARTQEICQSYITRKEITVYGSYIGAYAWHDTVRILESGMLRLEEMITHRISLEEFETGYMALKKGDAFEVIIYPNL